MTKVLVTGAAGEMGHGTITELNKNGHEIIALDVNDIGKDIGDKVSLFVKADVLDREALSKIFSGHKFGIVLHLAALLSTSAEKYPEKANEVNTLGTANLLSLATKQALDNGSPVKFFFPSTIAVYGIPIGEKKEIGRVNEGQYLNPITMYGINKLYCEDLGNYFSTNYRLLEDINRQSLIDFRAIRYPGILSADTVPTGGTSDYAPEMFHNAAKRNNYSCFVRPDTTIPFIVMPDAVNALLMLMDAPQKDLKHNVYNINGFSASAKEFAECAQTAFPDVVIDHKVDEKRQKIVDSWPAMVDDSSAAGDWGFRAKYDFENACSQYLLPGIKKKYSLAE